ncbi:hypothetical protein BMR05_04810 [Methylococcaceae bacterium HT4]|nr:hypothetical protein BMR05_04810 [Methylococcaceae bacterium HT4]TXL22084.1 hypothetical protein BMR03_10205 [Methylococcaceae bacterium HT2]
MATTNGSTAIRDKILASLARYRALRIGKFPCAFWRLSSRPGLTAVDTQKFYPEKTRKELPVCPLTFVEKNVYIGTVGRMHGVKDQITLVQAFVLLMQRHAELIGQVYLLLVGDGPLRAQAIELLEKHQLRQYVWLPGERQDIAEIMRTLDIFVLPSQNEGISNAILEAMATGLPVIATEVGGNPELVEQNQTGLLVPPESPESMVNALNVLIKDKQKRKQLGERSLQRVQDNFSIQVMVKNYTDVYDSLGLERKQ